MKFVHKPTVIEAIQWHQPGDHRWVKQAWRRNNGGVWVYITEPGKPNLNLGDWFPTNVITDENYAYTPVEPGNWIVEYGNGRCEVFTDENFRKNYMPVVNDQQPLSERNTAKPPLGVVVSQDVDKASLLPDRGQPSDRVTRVEICAMFDDLGEIRNAKEGETPKLWSVYTRHNDHLAEWHSDHLDVRAALKTSRDLALEYGAKRRVSKVTLKHIITSLKATRLLSLAS